MLPHLGVGELVGPGESYLGRTGEDTLYGVCLDGQVLLHVYFRLCRLSYSKGQLLLTVQAILQLRPATPGYALSAVWCGGVT